MFVSDDNPLRKTPWMTRALIAANVLVFMCQTRLWAFGMDNPVIQTWGLRGDDLANLDPRIALTLLSHQFLHENIFYLFFNMMFLWVFGDNVEDSMGRGRFLGFYLLCGALSACTLILWGTGEDAVFIGSSGAISGILGAYWLLFPRVTINWHTILNVMLITRPSGRTNVYGPTYNVPAFFFLPFWLAQSFMDLLSTHINTYMGPREAFTAFGIQVGGFVVGAALIAVFRDRHIPIFGPDPLDPRAPNRRKKTPQEELIEELQHRLTPAPASPADTLETSPKTAKTAAEHTGKTDPIPTPAHKGGFLRRRKSDTANGKWWGSKLPSRRHIPDVGEK